MLILSPKVARLRRINLGYTMKRLCRNPCRLPPTGNSEELFLKDNWTVGGRFCSGVSVTVEVKSSRKRGQESVSYC